MKNTFSVFIFILFLATSVVSQNTSADLTPEKLGYKSFTIDDKKLGAVNFYVKSESEDRQRPVLLYLDGSGPYPLFQKIPQGYGSTVPFSTKAVTAKYDLVLISKPGVPFVDTVKSDPKSGMPIYAAPEEYKKRLSLDWRVDAAKRVIDELTGKMKRKPAKIVVFGLSEGFQVGAKLASVDKRVTHAALFVGNGLNQFYDFIAFERQRVERGEITAQEAQKNIDELNAAFRDIYANLTATDKEWYGHTYLRWASFTNFNPTDGLVNSNIPIFIAACSKDRNSAVLSTDYLNLEFIRRGKTNLTYRVYPYDHFFNEQKTDESGKVIGATPHMQEVISEALAWVEHIIKT